jgi:hypothetical protein
MKLRPQLLTVSAAVCALTLGWPHRALAVTDEEFNALRDLVTKQGQKLEQLEKSHTLDQSTIEENQKIHQQDQQEIQRLKQQMQETQKTATDAQQKAAAAAQVQPALPAPEGPSASQNFMVVGDAEVQFGKTDGSHSAFQMADFAPIFLFRARDNILFEAGFDVTLQNGSVTLPNGNTHDAGASTAVSVSFAQLDYIYNDYVTFVAGDMLLPLGTYSERSAGWLNKIPDGPMARDLVPGSGVGAQLRGAVPLTVSGQSLAWSVYGANGPSSMDGTANHDQLDLGGNVGVKANGTVGNIHGAPSGGGRLGWFIPWKPHYDLELGISGQAGTWDDADRRMWSAGVVDASLHLGPNVELKGEYVRSWVETDDLGTIKPHGWWVQGSYKLAGLNLDLPLINNVELVGRYDTIRDGFFAQTDRYTLGYVYYFSNTLLFEGDYEFRSSNDPEANHNQLVFQVSYGF